jgi:hypothetical protein
MIAPELQRLLQILSNQSAATIDQTFRALRVRGLIPTSPRGGQPFAMQAEHATWALLALAIDRTPGQSAEVVSAWGDMRARDGKTPHMTLGAMLFDALSDPTGRLLVREVRICREWPLAVVIVGDEYAQTTYEFGAKSTDETKTYGTFRAAPVRSDFVINGGALHQIAIDLADAGVAEILT